MEPRHSPQRTDGSEKEPEKSPLNLSAELLTHFNLSDISDDDLPVPKAVKTKMTLLVNTRTADTKELEAELARRQEDESVVESASDLEDALEILSAQEIDLIALMLDPDCSETANFAAIERLHNHHPEVPIVVLVDNDDRSLAIESLRHGAQDYLAFDGLPFDELIERVLQYSLERKRADQVNHLALKLEKATIRSILEHSPMVMIRLDNRCRILDCNQSFEKALGLPKEEIKRKFLFDLVKELDLKGIRAIVSQGDNFKARIKLQSLKNSKYDATFWDVSGWPVMRSIAEVHEGIITATDVTREAYLEMERDEFVAALAHDLRNPVSGQILVLNALARESEETLPESLSGAFEKLHQSSKETMWLLNNLLDLYQSGTVMNDREPEATDLNDVLKEQIAQVSLFASVLGKHIEANLTDLPAVMVDEISLHRLFSNLLHNAIRFAPPDTTINITSAIKQEHDFSTATVQINNSGTPIGEEELRALFKRFNQPAYRSRNYQTRGLGLYLCRKIVELYEGSIDCQSDAVNGTTFTVTFPVPPN